jgi:hypothetical protein
MFELACKHEPRCLFVLKDTSAYQGPALLLQPYEPTLAWERLLQVRVAGGVGLLRSLQSLHSARPPWWGITGCHCSNIRVQAASQTPSVCLILTGSQPKVLCSLYLLVLVAAGTDYAIIGHLHGPSLLQYAVSWYFYLGLQWFASFNLAPAQEHAPCMLACNIHVLAL